MILEPRARRSPLARYTAALAPWALALAALVCGGAEAWAGEPAAPAPEAAPAEAAPTEASGGAGAQGTETAQDAPAEAPAPRAERSRSHYKRGSIAVAGGFGYGLRTAGDKFCGEFATDTGDGDGRKPLCTGLTPAFLDITLGYGVAKRLDLVLGVRVNLQKRSYDNGPCDGDPTCSEGKGLFLDSRGVGVLPGVRLWGSDVDRIFKLGGALDFFYMYENFQGYRDRPDGPREPGGGEGDANRANEAGVSDHILGLRGGPILQVDPHPNVGIFFIPAAVPSFRPKGSEARDLDAGWFEIGFDLSIGVQARFP